MSRYISERTLDGFGSLGTWGSLGEAKECGMFDFKCHTDNLADWADETTGGGWSKSREMREEAAKLIGIQPETEIVQGEKGDTITEYVEVARKNTIPIIAGIAGVGLVVFLVTRKRKK